MKDSIDAQLQTSVRELCEEWIGKGEETGLQAAAYYNGKQILDVHAGRMDAATERPVTDNTLFVGMSGSKGIAATVIHILAQAGKLDYDDRIADYWPEFAGNGKANITVRQLLTHEAGIPQMPDDADMDAVCDWERMIRLIERLSPVWEPGTRTGYHGFTTGWILGELAERADGRPFSQIVREEIAEPLGIERELFFGIPPEEEPRIAKIGGDELPWIDLPDHFLIKRMLPTPIMPLRHPAWNGPMIHEAVLPAANACLTANALARMYASLIGDGVDGVDGVRLLRPETMERATRLQTEEPDEIFMGAVIRKSLGYFLGNNESAAAMGDNPHAFGHTGMGGMIGFADPQLGFSFALLKNRLSFRGNRDTDVLVARKVREWLTRR